MNVIVVKHWDKKGFGFRVESVKTRKGCVRHVPSHAGYFEWIPEHTDHIPPSVTRKFARFPSQKAIVEYAKENIYALPIEFQLDLLSKIRMKLHGTNEKKERTTQKDFEVKHDLNPIYSPINRFACMVVTRQCSLTLF